MAWLRSALIITATTALAMGGLLTPLWAAMTWNVEATGWMIGVIMWAVVQCGLIVIAGTALNDWLDRRHG